jgi:hypothetical protein
VQNKFGISYKLGFLGTTVRFPQPVWTSSPFYGMADVDERARKLQEGRRKLER